MSKILTLMGYGVSVLLGTVLGIYLFLVVLQNDEEFRLRTLQIIVESELEENGNIRNLQVTNDRFR